MKKTIIILMVILAACNKSNMQGYRITNLGGDDLFITTPENTYRLETTRTIFFTSKSDNPGFRFEDESLKVLVAEIGTSPQRTMNISSYKHRFAVKVGGSSDSVRISINGQYFNEILPFYYGTDSPDESYQIYSTPSKIDGNTYTGVYVDGICVDIEYGQCNLSGRVN